jgi:hypothetical protein
MRNPGASVYVYVKSGRDTMSLLNTHSRSTMARALGPSKMVNMLHFFIMVTFAIR